jgi:hypothetical protein
MLQSGCSCRWRCVAACQSACVWRPSTSSNIMQHATSHTSHLEVCDLLSNRSCMLHVSLNLRVQVMDCVGSSERCQLACICHCVGCTNSNTWLWHMAGGAFPTSRRGVQPLEKLSSTQVCPLVCKLHHPNHSLSLTSTLCDHKPQARSSPPR